MRVARALFLQKILPLTTMIALVLLWVCFPAQPKHAAATITAADDAVGMKLIQIVNQQSQAWNRGNIAEFMTAYWKDERLTFSSSGKTERGWQATFENYKKNYPDRETMGKLTFSEFETQELSADAMLMLGRWQLDRTEPVGGNFTLVWKRIDNKWLIVHDHSSALKNEVK